MGMLPADGNIRMEKAPDGAGIRIGCWLAGNSAAGTVMLIHGRTEFLEKYEEVIGELTGRGFDVWSMDWRGQGRSDRLLPQPQKGHIDRFETYVSDLQWFADDIVEPRGGPAIVLSHSMGGHVAIRAVLEGAVAPDGLVAVAPMIALPLGRTGTAGARVLSAAATLARFGGRYGPGMADHDPGRVRFDGNPLTSDRERFDRFYASVARDPDLALGGVTWGWLDGAFRSMATLKRLTRAPRDVCPALICTAMADRVVSVDAQAALCAAVTGWEQVRFANARHEILMETDAIRARFWQAFDRFAETL